MKPNTKLIRITTVPLSLATLLKGQMRYMAQKGMAVIGVSSSGELLNEVGANEGVRTEVVEMTRTISPFQDLKAVWKMYQLFKKEKPQIVHTHTPKAGIVGMLAAKLAGVPHRLHTVAGLPLLVATGGKRKLLNGVEKLTYACASKVYPNSKGLYNIILQHRFTNADKLKVIGSGSSNGIDTSHFDPKLYTSSDSLALRNTLGIKEKDFVFLFVGRIVKDKGVNEMIKAFAKFSENRFDTHLVLVGDYEKALDPIAPEVEDEIKNNNKIHAVGFQKDVVPYFAMADTLVFPSYREGFPNVVMQAASMELNTIVTDINGCNEIVSSGENGWVIPVQDEQAVYDKLNYVYTHQEEAQAMGKKSRIRMQEQFERKFIWSCLWEEYQSVLNKS